MLEVALAKLASLGLAAKVSVAAGALAVSGSAAAASGNLPEPVQAHVADAAEQVLGLDLPGGSRVDADHRQDDGGPGVENHADPEANDFGQDVADMANTTDDKDRSFGDAVSGIARDLAPVEVPTAEDNPGTDHADEAEIPAPPAPADLPDADTNAGTDYSSGSAPAEAEERPTADANPGTAQRP